MCVSKKNSLNRFDDAKILIILVYKDSQNINDFGVQRLMKITKSCLGNFATPCKIQSQINTNSAI